MLFREPDTWWKNKPRELERCVRETERGRGITVVSVLNPECQLNEFLHIKSKDFICLFLCVLAHVQTHLTQRASGNNPAHA